MIRVITDSTSSIPPALREQLNITVLSLFVNHDGKEFEERTMDLDAFYSDIYAMADNIPTSSQPALSEIEKTFEEAALAGDDVLGLFLSSKMSGTFESVVRAAKGAAERHPSFKFVLIDSLTNCMELGWPVLSAAKKAMEGMSLADCANHACERLRATRFIFAPESLRFLEKGGRIGKASALLGNALHISPILTVKDGVASTYTKVRTQKKAMDKMISILKQDIEASGIRNVAVHYIGSIAPANTWADQIIRPEFGNDIPVIPASPVIGVHVGPAVGLAYECDKAIADKFSSCTPEVVFSGIDAGLLKFATA